MNADKTMEEATDAWTDLGVTDLPPTGVLSREHGEWENPLQDLALNTLRLSANTATEQARLLAS